MSKTRDNLIWLAAFIEGEGCITLDGGNNSSPGIKISTTDKDVLAKAAAICGKKIRKVKRRYHGYKQVYTLDVWGTRAVEILFSIFVLMGKRRKAAIKKVVQGWKKQYKRGFSPNKISSIRLASKLGIQNVDIARILNVDPSTISSIILRKTYKDV